PYNIGSTVGWHTAYELIDGTDWVESEVTWNTRPPSTPSYYLGSNIPLGSGMPIELDITHRVNQAIAEQRPIVIKIRLTSDTGSDGFVSYRSRDWCHTRCEPTGESHSPQV